jgi:hypothetical protein
MAEFKVKGALKETAEDVEITVEASSYRDAENKANKMGILVSDVLTVDSNSGSTDAPSTEKAILDIQKSKQIESNIAKTKTKQRVKVTCYLMLITVLGMFVANFWTDATPDQILTVGLLFIGLFGIMWLLNRLKLFFKHDE